MKASEAPEKLYIALSELTEDGRTFVLDHRVDYPTCTEYTRTDAFIEKACDWFRTLDDKEPPYKTTEEFIKDFRKYMEGE